MDFRWLGQQADSIIGMFWAHTVLSIVPVIVGLLLSIPLGWLAHGTPRLKAAVLGASGVLYTIPSLAMFVLLPKLLGTRILDPINVVVALTIYTVALLVRTVSDGLDSVPAETRQAAVAMGYQGFQRFVSVDLPVAVPVILAGLRVAVVSNVSIVSVASLIGVNQLGSLFTRGMQLQFLTPIIAGIVLCLALAVVLDGIILLIEKALTPWRPRIVTEAA